MFPGVLKQRFRISMCCLGVVSSSQALALEAEVRSLQRPLNSAEQVLSAPTMTDLAALAENYDLFVSLVDSIARAATDNPELAARAVHHVSELAAGQTKGEGWNLSRRVSRGFNLPSALVQGVSFRQPSPTTLGLAWKFFMHEGGGRYSPSVWPRQQGWQQVMFAAFARADGWQQPSAGMSSMLEEMRAVIGRDRPGLFSLGATAFAMELDPWELQVFTHQAWKRCGSGDPDADVARILRAVLQLRGHRVRGEIPAVSNAVWEKRSCGLMKILPDLVATGLAGPPACVAPANAGANPAEEGAAIPPNCQFVIAANLTRETAPLVIPAIVLNGLDTGCTTWERGGPTDESGWEILLSAFNTLPVTPEWEGAARRLLSLWSRAEKIPTSYPAVMACLDTAAQLGDPDLYHALTARHSNHARITRNFVMLVRHGHAELAETWLRQHLNNLVHREHGEIGWRPSDQTAVDRFCSGVRNPEMQLLARILIAANLPDGENLPREESARTLPRSADIMTRLAASFASTSFTDPRCRALCLRLLAENPHASWTLQKIIAGEATIDLPRLWNAGLRDAICDVLAIPVAHACNECSRGNFHPLRELLTQIDDGGQTPAVRWQRDSAMTEIIGRLGKTAAAFQPFADAETLNYWKEALRMGFTFDKGSPNDAAKADALCHLIALHVLTYSSGQLHKWRSNLPPAEQQSCAKALGAFRSRLVPSLSVMLRRGDDGWLPKDTRLGAILTILADPWMAEAIKDTPDLWHQFAACKVLDRLDMLHASSVIMQECPRDGRSAREMAAMSWQINQRDNATEFLAQAVQAATDPNLKARYQLGRDGLPR